MKIIHIASGGPFTEEMSYQENILASLGSRVGDEVVVVARPDKWTHGIIVNGPVGCTQSQSGYTVVRLPLFLSKLDSISKRLVKMRGLKRLLDTYKPDCIMLHGIGNAAMADVANYKKKNRNCSIIVDNHADVYNASKNPFVRLFLYRGFHRFMVRKYSRYFDKIVVVSESCRDFVAAYYGLAQDKVSIWRLGGIIPQKETAKSNRREIRSIFGIPEDAIVFIHTGKLTVEKRTNVVLDAFEKLNAPNTFLIVAGSATNDIGALLNKHASGNNKIVLYGWAEREELERLLQASDVYLQPGSASATLQQAICCGCVPIANLTCQYGEMFGSLVPHAESAEDFIREMKSLCCASNLEERKRNLERFAYETLDYKRQIQAIHDLVIDKNRRNESCE